MASAALAQDPRGPYDLELERVLLGCALGGTKQAGFLISAVPREAFAFPVHRAIFDGIAEMVRDNVQPDIISLKFRLKLKNKLDEQAKDAIHEAVEESWASGNLRDYAKQVTALFARRTLMLRARKLYELAEKSANTEAMLAQAFSLARQVPTFGTDTYRTGEIDIDAETLVEKGTPSGFSALDSICPGGGYYVGEFSLVVAPRGTGKTSWLTGSCLHAAKAGKKCGYATLEMPAVMIQRRMVQNLCGYGRRPLHGQERIDKYFEGKREVETLDIAIYDPSGRRGGDRNIEGLIAWAVDLHDLCGLDALFVDYGQKLNSNAKKFENRTRELDHIADELEWLAKKLGIALVVASQITEEPGRGGVGRAKDSRRFEDNAALVLYPRRVAGESECRVIVGKNRHGMEKVLSLEWNGQFARYEEPYDPYEDE